MVFEAVENSVGRTVFAVRFIAVVVAALGSVRNGDVLVAAFAGGDEGFDRLRHRLDDGFLRLDLRLELVRLPSVLLTQTMDEEKGDVSRQSVHDALCTVPVNFHTGVLSKYKGNAEQSAELSCPADGDTGVHAPLAGEELSGGARRVYVDTVVPGPGVDVDAFSCGDVKSAHVCMGDVVASAGGSETDGEGD